MPIPRTPIRSWTDAYLALKPYLEGLRGYVEIDSESHERECWPRTDGRDVITIAATLDAALRCAPQGGGSLAIRRRWLGCLDALDRDAWREPNEIYAENRSFWHVSADVCVHLDAAGDLPPDAPFWDAFFLDFAQQQVRNAAAPRPLSVVIDAWRDYIGKRGNDDRWPPIFSGILHIPATTNGDVAVIATLWNTRLAIAMAEHPGKLDDAAKKWNACLASTMAATKTAPVDAVYEENQAFWLCLSELASAIDRVTPPDVASMVERATDVITGIFDDLPGNLERGAATVAHETGKLFGDVASGIGDVAGRAAKGFLGEFTTPLLIVGGGLAALYLFTRQPDHHAEA